ncbi:MAG: toprim domain-containing protein [Candidatus Bathyarchaeota archaeon]|nr:toprim domain-containing protein [Candidatus Bathyarchaeota archaeon A05DMB-3]MDH7607515.1 toprim domain-containing protein [Candidatus Bathyarchaeota archaeon]
MSTHLKEKEEQILKILEQLAEENINGKPILVEGRKDIKALRNLGIKGKIISVKTGGKNLLNTISEIEASNLTEVILMLDFDRRGRELTTNLKRHIEKTGINANLHFWLRLSGLAGKEVKDVEGLATYIETLKNKTGNS